MRYWDSDSVGRFSQLEWTLFHRTRNARGNNFVRASVARTSGNRGRMRETIVEEQPTPVEPAAVAAAESAAPESP